MPVEFSSNLICFWPWMCLAFWSAQTGSNYTGFGWIGGCQLDLQLSTDTRLLQADSPPIPKFLIDAPAKRFKEVRLVQSVKRAIYGPGSPGTNVVSLFLFIFICFLLNDECIVWFSHDRPCPCSGKARQQDHGTFEEKSWISTSSVSAPNTNLTSSWPSSCLCVTYLEWPRATN